MFSICLKIESMLQIRKDKRDNLGKFFNITCCDPSLKPSHQDSSNEGSQHYVFVEKEKLSLNYPQYSLLSGALIFPLKTILSNYYNAYKRLMYR